jgi:hypothetical protein
MAKHENFSILGHRLHPANGDELDGATDEAVEEGQGYDR